MAQHGHSDVGYWQSYESVLTHTEYFQACCNIPPIVAKGYSPKGKYIDIDGMKTCTPPRLQNIRRNASQKPTDHLIPHTQTPPAPPPPKKPS